jgi:hypothetical protein
VLVAFVGTYLPRRCGIGTFTADLCRAVAQSDGGPERTFAVALNDRPEGYDYPPAKCATRSGRGRSPTIGGRRTF